MNTNTIKDFLYIRKRKQIQSIKGIADVPMISDCVGKISGIIYDRAFSGICLGLKLRISLAYAIIKYGSGNTIEAPIQPRWCFQKTGS